MKEIEDLQDEVLALKIKLVDLEDKFSQMMFHFMPPDTPARRRILATYKEDREESLKHLKKEAKKDGN